MIVDVLRASRILPLSLLLTLAFSSSALAASVYVTNNGTDSGTCGPKADPCRSITRGIANSAIGGSVVVGPGLYGDIDRDGTLAETGEESGGACDAGTCLITIDKQVTVTSSDGAFATLITIGSHPVDALVGIDASGAVFGGKQKGFTLQLSAATAGGVKCLNPVQDVVIAGNVISGTQGNSGIATSCSNLQVLGNRLLGPTGGYGLYVTGDSVVVTGNAASAAFAGLYFEGDGAVVTANVASGNNYGVVIAGTGIQVSKSSFTGNAFAGIAVLNMTNTATFTECNVFGNGAGTFAPNCGLFGANSAVTVTDSYWGAPAGPGADPSDLACDVPVGSVTPFATAPIKIKVKPLR